MIVFPPLRIPWDRYLRWFGICAAALVGVALCSMSLLLFFTSSHSERLLAINGSDLAHRRVVFAHEMIGSGPLGLRPVHAHGWVARLAEEMVLIAYDSRPDTSAADARVLLGFKQGKEQLTLLNGKSFYLKESEQGKGLHSSMEPTGLWARPIVLEGGSVLFEVGRRLTSGEGEEVEEKAQFIAGSQGGSMRQAQQECALDLKGAKAFPLDSLLQKYGGKEFASFAVQAVLEISSRVGSYALSVASGDYLAYEEGEWRQKPLQEIRRDQPVAYVRSALEKGIELDVWDEQGFYPLHVVLDAKRQMTSPFGPDALPSAVRLRTGTQVSCSMGKRRLILKQGDWLLRTSSGWRHLRGLEEIKLYLDRRLKGDLFIFDGIEKESQNKCSLRGNLFDETRTYVQPVSVPINMDKQQNKPGKKRRLRGVR